MRPTRIVYSASATKTLYKHPVTEQHLQTLLAGSLPLHRHRIRALGAPITGQWFRHSFEGVWFMPDGAASYAKEPA